MAEGDKNLRETIQGVVETNPTPKESKPNDISQTTKEETNAGETSNEPEYVSGIDISDIPVSDRPRIKELLEKKASLLEKGYQGKFQEVAKFKKAQEELINMGLSIDEAQEVLSKHIQQKQNPTTTISQKKEAIKKLDKLAELTPEQKTSLEDLRQIILEETNVSELNKKVDELTKTLQYLQGKDLQSTRQVFESELKTLENSKFGGLISKYREEIMAQHRINPLIKPKDILKYVVPDDEYEQAIITSKGKPLTKEKKEAISSNNSGMVASTETVSTKGTWKDTISELIKLKK